MVDRTGQLIGNYRIVRLLGEGGFAEVYLGEHIHLGTEAAIKVLHTQLAGEETGQFRAEARLIASLDHPNIVRVLDFGLAEKTPFLVMSYAPNGTLRQLHKRKEPVPLSSIVQYVGQVADALFYAHQQRLVHRDVKPENMLIGRRNEILLSDFGIAFVSQSSRYQGTHDIVGTVSYMAPEQIRGRPRPASDQYSLAVVVYEWLTGDRPFHGSFTEIAVQHTIAPPPPLREKIPGIAPEVEYVVLTALAKEPEQRFATIRAFANALQQASNVGGQTVYDWQSTLVSPPPQPQRPLTPLPPTFTPLPPPPPSYPASFQQSGSQPPVILTPQGVSNTPPGRYYQSSTDPNEPEPPRRGISRRTLLLGATALVLLAGSGATVLALAAQHLGSSATTPTPGATPTTGGTTVPKVSPTSRTANHTPTPTTVPSTPSPSANGASPTTTPTVANTPTTTPTTPTTPPPAKIVSTPLSTYNGHTNNVYAVTWASADQQRMASGGLDNTVLDWNRATNQLYFSYTQGLEINDVKASPSKQYIASASDDMTVKVYDASAGTSISTYSSHSSGVNTVRWSSDGTLLLTSSTDQTARIWRLSDLATLHVLQGHTARVWAAAWSPDMKYAVTASADRTAIVWDASIGQIISIYKGHSDALRAVSWSPRSTQIATASQDGTVQIWDGLTGAHILTYTGHTGQVLSVEWSHAGTSIVSGSKDQTAQVWNPANGAQLLIFKGHTNSVFDAQWSPDDTLIASASSDKTVQIWQSS
ncbi:MAG TPA: serine/threonine-protein kinase [Ktedonobacteraceae bacterium]|nr:serine/threonine-protein kinase [Ktedonobacteraceae bacterium]